MLGISDPTTAIRVSANALPPTHHAHLLFAPLKAEAADRGERLRIAGICLHTLHHDYAFISPLASFQFCNNVIESVYLPRGLPPRTEPRSE